MPLIESVCFEEEYLWDEVLKLLYNVFFVLGFDPFWPRELIPDQFLVA